MIRDESRDYEINYHEFQAGKEKYAMEIEVLRESVDKLKNSIHQNTLMIDNLSIDKDRKEDEIIHLQKLISNLRTNRQENIEISKNRIVRQEEGLSNMKYEHMRLSSKKEGLLHTSSIFNNHKRGEGENLGNNDGRTARFVSNII